MSYVSRFFSRMFDSANDGFNWLIYEMDVYQWGIVAGLFVLTGFMALKTKI